MLTDHKKLEYFMTTKKLTFKQARYAEFLLKYNFIISYQSGKKNNKADALTCKLNKRPVDGNNKKLKHHMQMLLSPKRFEHAVNLQSIEKDAEPHAELQTSTISAKHRPNVSKLLTLLEEIKDAN